MAYGISSLSIRIIYVTELYQGCNKSENFISCYGLLLWHKAVSQYALQFASNSLISNAPKLPSINAWAQAKSLPPTAPPAFEAFL